MSLIGHLFNEQVVTNLVTKNYTLKDIVNAIKECMNPYWILSKDKLYE